MDTEIILIREFRSAVRNASGFIHELPGGSSHREQAPLQVAAEEVHEETGIIIPPMRFRSLGSRQMIGTLSSHHAHLFAVELTPAEMAQAKAVAAAGTAYGVEEDCERTYVEVTTFRDLLAGSLVDWTTVGMVAQALLGDS